MGSLKIKNPETGLWEVAGAPVDVKGMTMDLLWENPEPDAEFPAQTVALNLSGYDFVGVYYKVRTGGAYASDLVVLPPLSVGMQANPTLWNNGSNIDTTKKTSRLTQIVSGGVRFDIGYETAGSASEENLGCMIPLQIYGIKNTPVTYPEGGGTIESIEHPGCFYRMVNGVQEWLNPPMELGVEYKTTERYMGKPVYVKVVDFGALPNATYKPVAHNSSNIDYMVEVFAQAKKTTFPGGINIPMANGFGGERADIVSNNTHIYITTASDMTAFDICHVTLKYTKTTD